ncbi:TylF/MycF/NovP-related O-methyltransferase [Phyllobacterium sp. P30BS-XVII]|uniref:TylF/MycF/NovP-related O-methyltransferase n=1 Tax=Phyllobacterium sp. P30BS-XVII TaxID=2587046 RepID=UPI0015FD3819|nr:TylF/MycF/NovP-related O-methyltransferase [Phyllobacterium sp. P30BS-XVII]MBA8904168.1 hypothetical protein [Phyllobacterium sp. P30BS-XVII]
MTSMPTDRAYSLEQLIASLQDRMDEYERNNAELLKRVSHLERRLLAHNRFRWDAIDKIADYFRGAFVKGDYLEFGVYQGETFAYACNVMAPMYPDMRFIALDSFEGLPQPKTGIDEDNGYSGGFYKGQFYCDETEFIANLVARSVDMDRVMVVKGWYDETLRMDNPKTHSIESVAFAWVDCDLYESTVPVLQYLTNRLTVGSVILFDDWRCFRNLSGFGQQRACREWLARNPQIKLNLLMDNDYHGYVFSVAAC